MHHYSKMYSCTCMNMYGYVYAFTYFIQADIVAQSMYNIG